MHIVEIEGGLVTSYDPDVLVIDYDEIDAEDEDYLRELLTTLIQSVPDHHAELLHLVVRFVKDLEGR